MRIGIAGITGRVGQLLIEEVRAAGATVAGGTTRAPEQATGWQPRFHYLPACLLWRKNATW